MDYHRMTAPCGRDCFNCLVYLANDNPRLRAIIARKRNVPEEHVRCKGCRDEGGCIPFLNWTEPCALLLCAQNKGVEFCCECDDFPCDMLHPVVDLADQFPHNTKVFNLCLIKKMGLEAWAQDKAKKVFDTYMKGKLMEILKRDSEG